MAEPSTHTLRSMTAYGRGVHTFSYGRMTVEIQSLNRRFLEISLNLPRSLNRFEGFIRKIVEKQVGRGALTISLFWHSLTNQPLTILPNLALAKSLKEAWETIIEELQLKTPFPLELLARERDILLFEEDTREEEIYERAIEAVLFQALAALRKMKEWEGQILLQDIEARVEILEHTLSTIESQSGQGVEKYRQKLQGRLKELWGPNSADYDERLLKEIALYAEKMDTTEESIRFKSHLKHFKQLIETPLEQLSETKGKTLDFLIQELNREANTLGSKSADPDISKRVITLKSELEKIREQIQNIE